MKKNTKTAKKPVVAPKAKAKAKVKTKPPRVEEVQDRCVVCGKSMEGKSVLILEGSYAASDGFEEEGEFGALHRGCFLRTFSTPDNVLEALHQEAAQS